MFKAIVIINSFEDLLQYVNVLESSELAFEYAAKIIEEENKKKNVFSDSNTNIESKLELKEIDSMNYFIMVNEKQVGIIFITEVPDDCEDSEYSSIYQHKIKEESV